jgi:hypothetical protein
MGQGYCHMTGLSSRGLRELDGRVIRRGERVGVERLSERLDLFPVTLFVREH